MRRKIDFNLLLDIGHLKVSANSLRLDFMNELRNFWPCSDYLHLSDNDGLSDQHRGIVEGSAAALLLEQFGIRGKKVTLEVNGDGSDLRDSYRLIERLQ